MTEETDRSGDAQASPDMQSELEALRSKVDELEKSVGVYKDQLLRKAAEFENYKRRKDGEYASLMSGANEFLMLSLLPILNDFIRSLRAGQEARDYDAFYKGVEMIYDKLNKTLEAHGLTALESVGRPFDVQYHDALLQVPRDDVPPHIVIEEVERGYKLNDKVVRHARVIVSAPVNPDAGSASVPENGQGGGEENN